MATPKKRSKPAKPKNKGKDPVIENGYANAPMYVTGGGGWGMNADFLSVVVPNPIEKISIDYGREDLNTIARKINELIDYLNGTQGQKDA